MPTVEEIFGPLDEYVDLAGSGSSDFDLLPEGTRVLAKVESVAGKENVNHKFYPAIVLKVVSTPADLPGNFGHPTLWDNYQLTLPDNPKRFADADPEVYKKKKTAMGIWVRRCRAIGADPAGMALAEVSAAEVGRVFQVAVGQNTIVRVGVEAATDKYPAKNVVKDYEPVTDKALAKYKLTQSVEAEEVPF